MCGLWSTALACALPDGGPCGIHTHLASCCWTTATEALARTSCSSPALSAPGHSGSEQAQQASSPLHGVCWHPPPGTRHSLRNHQVHRKPTNVVELHEKRDCGGPALCLARGVLHQQNQRLKALCVRPNSPRSPHCPAPAPQGQTAGWGHRRPGLTPPSSGSWARWYCPPFSAPLRASQSCLEKGQRKIWKCQKITCLH